MGFLLTRGMRPSRSGRTMGLSMR